MTLIFYHYRPAGSAEYPVYINRVNNDYSAASSECFLWDISVSRHEEASEINSVKVEVIDNKPLYIPLGSAGPAYKIQFKTFTIPEFNMWYTVLGNDILRVIDSDYPEFPIGSYWNVDSITDQELLGSAFSISPTLNGHQTIIFEYELQLTRSLVTASGKTRTPITEDSYAL